MRILWCAVLLGLLGALGCVELPLLRDYGTPVANAKREHPVTAAEVTADNANEIANALRDELEKDQATLSKAASEKD